MDPAEGPDEHPETEIDRNFRLPRNNLRREDSELHEKHDKNEEQYRRCLMSLAASKSNCKSPLCR